MSFTINREAIKALSGMHIDSQYAHQVGVQIFNNPGQLTEDHQELYNKLTKACDDIIADCQTVKNAIPALNNEK